MFDGTWGNNIDTPQEILDLFEQGRKTTDVEKRTEIYKELQEKAMESYLTYPIAYPNYCFATSDNLEQRHIQQHQYLRIIQNCLSNKINVTR